MRNTRCSVLDVDTMHSCDVTQFWRFNPCKTKVNIHNFRLVFIAETENVYCAVRTGYIRIILILGLGQGSGGWSPASHYEAGFDPRAVHVSETVALSFHQCCTLIFVYLPDHERVKPENPPSSSAFFSEIGVQWIGEYLPGRQR